MKTRLLTTCLSACAMLLLSGCDFDFPLTAQPTRAVDQRLIGNWRSREDKEHKSEQMNVRKLDDSTYIVSYEGDLYRAHHSDLGGLALLSVQDLNPAPGSYLYMQYQLSADGTHLVLKPVSAKFVPATAKDHAAVAKFIRENAGNPKLYGEDCAFERQASLH
jgi:hypothetical protein